MSVNPKRDSKVKRSVAPKRLNETTTPVRAIAQTIARNHGGEITIKL